MRVKSYLQGYIFTIKYICPIYNIAIEKTQTLQKKNEAIHKQTYTQ